MSKYYRRVGTTAFRFLIEVNIQKIELKVPNTNPHPQRLSVIFKRGELRKETNNAPLMENGTAYFNEKLALPGILYYDNRKKTFLQKEATLAVNLISKRSTKLMGVTRFDLGTFVNSNNKEKDVVLKMEKCSDKNAKFYFKLVITQVKELGSNVRKMSIKESSIRSGSFRGSMKEVSSYTFKDSVRESFKEKVTEESKASYLQKIDDEADELYSYYTESETSPKRLPIEQEENEENNPMILNSPQNIAFGQLRASNEPDVCNVSMLEKTMSEKKEFPEWKETETQEEECHFDLLETVVPQRCLSPEIKKFGSRTDSLFQKNQSARALEEKLLNCERELENVSKVLRSRNEDFASLKEDYEKLQKTVNTQNQKYETPRNKEYNDEDKENIPNTSYCQTKNYDLERKIKQLEDQNDIMNKKVEELEKLNQEYLLRIEKYIEEKSQPELMTSTANPGHQYETVVEEIVSHLKDYKQIPQNDIDNFEDKMYEMINKIKESETIIYKLKELNRAEKEKHQKEVEQLEQGVQRLIREYDQYHTKNQIKGALTYYDKGFNHSQTMSANSLKTREESIAEEPSMRGILYDSAEHNSSDFKGSSRILGAQMTENKGGLNSAEMISLKQEINYLNAKLFIMTNIQRQYEEQVKQRHFFQQENKILKGELEKANKGWIYAEEERYELANKLKEFKDTPINTVDRTEALEMDVFKLKTKLGEILNVAHEIGGTEILDKIEHILMQEDFEEFPVNSNKQTFAF